MTVRVGINGSAGSAATSSAGRCRRRRHRDRRGQRPDRQQDARAPAQVRLDPGRLDGETSHDRVDITADGHTFKVFEERDPQLPTGRLGADIVIESTGFFTDADQGQGHIDGGAKKVIISAPAKNEDVTIVMGVNEGDYDPATHHDHLQRVVHHQLPGADDEGAPRRARHRRGLMTTIHAYTGDQNLQDGPHRTCGAPGRRPQHRPTSTGAAKAIGPGPARTEGQGSTATPCASRPDRLGDRPDLRGRPRDHGRRGQRRREGAAEGPRLKDPALHRGPDRLQRHHHRPGVVHLRRGLTKVIGNQVKVVGWYDNEWGYSNRLVDLVDYVGDSLTTALTVGD